MPERMRLQESEWWRFERYELKGGKVCPAPNAKGENYSPWATYESGKLTTKGRSPYTELLTLVSVLGLSPPDNYDSLLGQGSADVESCMKKKWSADQIGAILTWCSKWGLLGLLPHRVSRIALSENAKLSNYGYVDPRLRTLGSDATLHDYGWVHQRLNGVWESHLHGPAEHPSVIVSNPTFEVRSLTEAVWPYFPSVPKNRAESFQYPRPQSREFWRRYAEPVEEFLQWAAIFAHEVARMSPKFVAENSARAAKARTLLPGHRIPPPLNDRTVHLSTLPQMNALVEPIGQFVGWSDDYSEIRLRWRSPSLISWFALMAIHDTRAGTRVEACRACSQVFSTNSYQALYCSEGCAWRDRKRKARAAAKGENHGEETR